MKATPHILILSTLLLFLYSCTKDENSSKRQLNIDAKLIISQPSTIIVDLSENGFELKIKQILS